MASLIVFLLAIIISLVSSTSPGHQEMIKLSSDLAALQTLARADPVGFVAALRKRGFKKSAAGGMIPSTRPKIHQNRQPAHRQPKNFSENLT
jgi:hypothetical protein